MSLVATLICNPANPALDSTIVDGARAVLPSPEPAQWLFDEVAVDIPFAGQMASAGDLRTIESALRAARGDLPIDIVVQSRDFRRKKLFLADMDSTMIEQECIDELADFAGLKAEISMVTESAMRGEIAFEGVSFAYNPNEPVLRDVSIRIPFLAPIPVRIPTRTNARLPVLAPIGATRFWIRHLSPVADR